MFFFFFLPKYKSSTFHQPETVHQSSSSKNYLNEGGKIKHKKTTWSIVGIHEFLYNHSETFHSFSVNPPVQYRQKGKIWWSPAYKNKENWHWSNFQKQNPLIVSLSLKQTINTHWTQNRHDLLAFVPDAKDPVEKEAPKEAEDHVGPGVPGIELHELCSVQVQVLVQSEGRKTQNGDSYLSLSLCFGFTFHH